MDPRNSAVTPPASVEWTPPSAEETAEVRQIVDVHRTDSREYMRRVRGELIEVEEDEFGCLVITDNTGEYPAITLECPEGGE